MAEGQVIIDDNGGVLLGGTPPGAHRKVTIKRQQPLTGPSPVPMNELRIPHVHLISNAVLESVVITQHGQPPIPFNSPATGVIDGPQSDPATGTRPFTISVHNSGADIVVST